MRPVQGHPRRRAARQRTGGSQRTSPACQPPAPAFQQLPSRRLPWLPFGSAAAPRPPPSPGPALGPSGSTRPRPGLSAGETLASEPTQPAPGATQPCGQRRGGWGVTTASRAGAVAEAGPSPRCGSTTPRTLPRTQAGGPARPEEAGLGRGLARAPYVLLPGAVGRTGPRGGTWL